jgi:putative spermidine/putrescine transport system substrate-binding protein
MPARTMLLAAALVAACLPGASAQTRDLTVVARPGTPLEAVRKSVATPFTTATGIPVRVTTWPGGEAALDTQLKSAEHPWNVVELNPAELGTACGAGQLEKLDWSEIGGKAHYLPQGVSNCGVGAVMTTLVLTWDRNKSPTAPNWADFWDVAKFPGKRGLYKGVKGNLEFALMADGVAPADVYKALSTTDGVDRAFHKLDQLKPYIVWWDNGAQAAHILQSGDVLMTTAPASDIVAADRLQHRNFGIQWNAALYQVDSWAIPKGTPDLKQAEQFLYFAGMPAVEARLFELSGLSGLAKSANAFLSPEMQPLAVTLPANMKGALPIDQAFWHDNLAKLQQRFDAWMQAK